MTSKNDLGIAILEFLIEKGGQVGYTFAMNEFIIQKIKVTNDLSKLNTWIASEIIDDMFKMGYVKTIERFGIAGIHNFGRPEEQHIEPKGHQDIVLGLTWKGKAFYYEHVNKGKFDTREKFGLFAILIMTVISLIATIIQTSYTIIDHNKNELRHIEKVNLNSGIKIKSSPINKPAKHFNDSTIKKTSILK
jgi:hypothetical protein